MAGGATFSPQLLVDGKRPYDKYPPASEMIPRAILKYLKEPIMPTTFAVISWPLYTALADRFGRQGWSEAAFFTLLSCCMITATWAFFNGAYALIEYMRWFDRYKMDRQPHQLGTWKMALSTIRETLIGRLLVAPLGIYLVGTTILQHRGMLQQVFDLQRPPVTHLYLCFLAGSIFNEVAFYWAHRAMHSSYLYARFHKQHHEWKGTVSYAAENAHPVEQLFANYIPTFGGCLLMGAHPWIFILWICERLRTTYEGHSGYAFNVHPLVDALNITNYRAAAQHDFHSSAQARRKTVKYRSCTMSFYRALSRTIITGYKQNRAVVPWYQQEQKLSAVEQWYKDTVYPVWFKYVKGPYERYYYEHTVAELRSYGLMFDDQHNDKEPLVERALELLPHDLAVGRYRRMMRAFEMNAKKTHLPVEEQNYDPMVPYLAPFMEEAKFQMQEEQELLRFHPWDRRLYSGPTTGFGETTPNSVFSCW